jgi:hypothetical protein
LLKRDLEVLKRDTYHILPKSDGTRYILFAFTNEKGEYVIDMIDRLGSHCIISLTFKASVFKGTILDGELTVTKDGEYQYQVFDCIISREAKMMEKVYSSRLTEAQNICEKHYQYQSRSDPFRIVVKDVIKPNVAIELCYADSFTVVNYPTDGLILVSESRGYQCGKDNNLFKFKNKEDQTVDFKVTVSCTGDKRYFGNLFIIDQGQLKCIYPIELLNQDLATLKIGSW